MFRWEIGIVTGESVAREHFVFADLIPEETHRASGSAASSGIAREGV
jgi:hypothetical protein